MHKIHISSAYIHSPDRSQYAEIDLDVNFEAETEEKVQNKVEEFRSSLIVAFSLCFEPVIIEFSFERKEE